MRKFLLIWTALVFSSNAFANDLDDLRRAMIDISDEGSSSIYRNIRSAANGGTIEAILEALGRDQTATVALLGRLQGNPLSANTAYQQMIVHFAESNDRIVRNTARNSFRSSHPTPTLTRINKLLGDLRSDALGNLRYYNQIELIRDTDNVFELADRIRSSPNESYLYRYSGPDQIDSVRSELTYGLERIVRELAKLEQTAETRYLLRQFALNPSDGIRSTAINQMVAHPHQDFSSTIAQLARDNNPSIRASALSQIENPFYAQGLYASVAQLANDSDPLRRMSAASALSQMPTAEAQSLILALMQDRTQSVKDQALQAALHHIDSPQIAEALFRLPPGSRPAGFDIALRSVRNPETAEVVASGILRDVGRGTRFAGDTEIMADLASHHPGVREQLAAAQSGSRHADVTGRRLRRDFAAGVPERRAAGGYREPSIPTQQRVRVEVSSGGQVETTRARSGTAGSELEQTQSACAATNVLRHVVTELRH